MLLSAVSTAWPNGRERRIGAVCLTAGHADAFLGRLDDLADQLELVGVLDGVVSRHRRIGEVTDHFAGLQLLEGVGILLGDHHVDGLLAGLGALLGQALALVVAGALQVIDFGRAALGRHRSCRTGPSAVLMFFGLPLAATKDCPALK